VSRPAVGPPAATPSVTEWKPRTARPAGTPAPVHGSRRSGAGGRPPAPWGGPRDRRTRAPRRPAGAPDARRASPTRPGAPPTSPASRPGPERGRRDLAQTDTAAGGARPDEEGHDRARPSELVAVVEVVRAGVVEVDRLLDQPQAQHPDVEVDVALGVAGDRGHMVDARHGCHRTWLSCTRGGCAASVHHSTGDCTCNHVPARRPASSQGAILRGAGWRAGTRSEAQGMAGVRRGAHRGDGRPGAGSWTERRGMSLTLVRRPAQAQRGARRAAAMSELADSIVISRSGSAGPRDGWRRRG